MKLTRLKRKKLSLNRHDISSSASSSEERNEKRSNKIGKNCVFAVKIGSFSSAIMSFSDVKKAFLNVKRKHFRAQKAVLFQLNSIWKNVFFRCKNHIIFSRKISEKKDSTFSTNAWSSHASAAIKTSLDHLQESHW